MPLINLNKIMKYKSILSIRQIYENYPISLLLHTFVLVDFILLETKKHRRIKSFLFF